MEFNCALKHKLSVREWPPGRGGTERRLKTDWGEDWLSKGDVTLLLSPTMNWAFPGDEFLGLFKISREKSELCKACASRFKSRLCEASDGVDAVSAITDRSLAYISRQLEKQTKSSGYLLLPRTSCRNRQEKCAWQAQVNTSLALLRSSPRAK